MAAKRKTELSSTNNPSTKESKLGHWSMGLKSSMDDPDLRLYADEKVVVIKDKYPKAKHHFLVLPVVNISSLKSLRKEHLDILEYMEEKGREISKPYTDNFNFKYGYHAVPSMSHLHLHVISDDLISPCLKTKKHFNSFATSYFVDSSEIITQLREKGSVKNVSNEEAKELLNTPLKCHKCGAAKNNMPNLKLHIESHFSKKT